MSQTHWSPGGAQDPSPRREPWDHASRSRQGPGLDSRLHASRTTDVVGYHLAPRRGWGIAAVISLLWSVAAIAVPPSSSYKITPVPGPENGILEVGGMDWMPDGRLAVCTRRGEVWTLSGSQWKLFASGLQEALGLVHGEKNDLFVMQRPELTHLLDTKGTGAADRYQTVTADFGFSGNYHEFAYGPARDKDGYVYFSLNLAHDPDKFGGPFMGAHPATPYRGWIFRSNKPNAVDGRFSPYCYGLRSPNGLAASPDGDIFFAENQGEWVGACWLGHVKEGAFYGNPSSMIFTKDWNNRDPKSVSLEELEKIKTPPAVVFPYGRMGQSLSQPAWDTTGGKFGPFTGQIFIGDVQIPIVMRATLEKVDGDFQGACYPFLRTSDLQGANRLLFAPDGSLLVGLTDRGWVKGSNGIVRISYTGDVPFEILSMSLTKTGFDLTFTKPVDKTLATDPKTYSLLHWHVIYHHDYGSPEADKTPAKITAIKVSEDGRRVSLELAEVVPKKVYDLTINGLKAADGMELKNVNAYYTLNRLRK